MVVYFKNSILSLASKITVTITMAVSLGNLMTILAYVVISNFGRTIMKKSNCFVSVLLGVALLWRLVVRHPNARYSIN